jgi:hypothetical protein
LSAIRQGTYASRLLADYLLLPVNINIGSKYFTESLAAQILNP